MSVVCKTLVRQIMNHLKVNNIICGNQFGFRSGHCCETQLLVTDNDYAYTSITNCK